MATKLTKGTTGIGEFFFAHLQSPEVFQGSLQINSLSA